MNNTLCGGAKNKGCSDNMYNYMTIEYPNYQIFSLLTQPRENCVNVMRLRNSRFHFWTWTRILTTATQCVTIELRRPSSYRVDAQCPPFIITAEKQLFWTDQESYKAYFIGNRIPFNALLREWQSSQKKIQAFILKVTEKLMSLPRWPDWQFDLLSSYAFYKFFL